MIVKAWLKHINLALTLFENVENTLDSVCFFSRKRIKANIKRKLRELGTTSKVLGSVIKLVLPIAKSIMSMIPILLVV